MTTITTKHRCKQTMLGSVRPGDIFISSKHGLCVLVNRSRDDTSLIKSFSDNRPYTESNKSLVSLVESSSTGE